MRPQPGEVAVPDPRDDLAQPAPSDPDIPAENHQRARVPCRPGSRRKVEGNRCTDIAAPARQPELFIVVQPNEAEPGRGGQYLPCHREPVDHFTHALSILITARSFAASAKGPGETSRKSATPTGVFSSFLRAKQARSANVRTGSSA
jgi:hypothetical protein